MSIQKILIIDDSAVQANYLRSILEDDYQVAVVHTGKEGLEQAMSGEYSLVLLDVIMPDMDGFSLLREMQESIVTKYIPVIMITSLSDTYSEERGLVLGAVDYIAKPFHPMIVKARVNTHIKLYQYRLQIQRQALVDELTGVANRRQYDNYSAVKWQEAVRLGKPISICMFDIDLFKLYNDTYGHPAGDKVIAAVAGAVDSRLQRVTDFFARYGGEEFVALTMGDPSEKIFPHLVKIRQEIENLRIPHDPSVSQWVTVSIGGVTVIPKMGDAYDFYLKIADTMLYDAKKQGRNRVIWADERMRLMGEPSHALSVHETGGNA